YRTYASDNARLPGRRTGRPPGGPFGKPAVPGKGYGPFRHDRVRRRLMRTVCKEGRGGQSSMTPFVNEDVVFDHRFGPEPPAEIRLPGKQFGRIAARLDLNI